MFIRTSAAANNRDRKIFVRYNSRNSKVRGASAVEPTSETANHEHSLTIGRLHPEASGDRAIQVWISRDIRNLFTLGTIHWLPSVSQWNARIRPIPDAEGCPGTRKQAEITSSTASSDYRRTSVGYALLNRGGGRLREILSRRAGSSYN